MRFFVIFKSSFISLNNNFKVFFNDDICINIGLQFMISKLINTDFININNNLLNISIN